MSFMTDEEIKELGFNYVGKNVKLSRLASFYNCNRISIGSNSRIDDFCVLSAGEGGIDIGCHVHIAVHSLLIGKGKIKLDDFSGVSSRTSIYSSSDDYSGRHMTNPTVPDKFTNVFHADVELGKHVIVGAGTVILPGVYIGEGAAIGALSFVSKNCESFYVYSGNPLKKIKERHHDLIELEARLESGGVINE